MINRIKLTYHSVFKYPDHNESVKFSSEGYKEENDDYMEFRIKHQEYNIKISIKDDEIILNNNGSILKLKENELIENDYETEYGIMNITTCLLINDHQDSLRIKYQLLDGDKILSNAYLSLNYKIMEN
ncbi:MAG: DUF1934 domain-containing protein [Thomasclavelia sp.]|nr:DUF1934 domain-containing protein [Thomasclavelia sp.]